MNAKVICDGLSQGSLEVLGYAPTHDVQAGLHAAAEWYAATGRVVPATKGQG